MVGLQGLRTGWMISRDSQLLFDSMVLREDTSEIMNIMGEVIADIALGEHRFAESIATARQAGEENLNLINDFVQSHAELSLVRPQAGLIGLCRFNSDVDAAEVSERLLAAPYRTFVIPGNAYGYPHHMRVGAGGAGTDEVAQGLARLARFFRDHNHVYSGFALRYFHHAR